MIRVTEIGHESVKEAFEKIERSPEYSHLVDEIRSKFYEAIGKLCMRSDTIELRGGFCKVGKWEDNGEAKTWLELEFTLSWLNTGTGQAYMHGGLNWSESQKTFTVNT